MEPITDETTVGIHAGSVEYSLEEAAIPIEELIAALQTAQEDGATYVVGFSGNYRGARYVRLSSFVEEVAE